MPKKNHRSACADKWACEEDAPATSPVKVAYPSPECGDFPTPVEESPAAEEALVDAPIPAEEYSPAEEPAEEPLAEPPDKELPDELAPELATEEVPSEYLLIKEPKSDHESEAIEQPDVQTGSEADVSNGDSAEKLKEQAGKVVLVCTSCTTMLLIEYDGCCPYSVKSFMDSDYESYSWLLHTTCLSCMNKHKNKFSSKDDFGNKCKAAFTTAVLSEEFMKQTLWFEIADSVCQKPTKILMDKERRSVGYTKIDTIRDESTVKCKIRGLKSGRGLGKEGEAVESFVLGGFL
jgi:hypothetical protein